MALKKSLKHTLTRTHSLEWEEEKKIIYRVCVSFFFGRSLIRFRSEACLSVTCTLISHSFICLCSQSTAHHDPNHKFVRYENGALLWIWYPLLDIFFRIFYYHISFFRSFYSTKCKAFKLNSFEMNAHCFLLLFCRPLFLVSVSVSVFFFPFPVHNSKGGHHCQIRS